MACAVDSLLIAVRTSSRDPFVPVGSFSLAIASIRSRAELRNLLFNSLVGCTSGKNAGQWGLNIGLELIVLVGSGALASFSSFIHPLSNRGHVGSCGVGSGLYVLLVTASPGHKAFSPVSLSIFNSSIG